MDFKHAAKRFEERFHTSQIIAVELVAVISPYYEENTCHR